MNDIPEDVIKAAKDAEAEALNISMTGHAHSHMPIVHAILAERERCAALAEEQISVAHAPCLPSWEGGWSACGEALAFAIRGKD